MNRLALIFLFAIFPQVCAATVYTLGTLEDWQSRLDSASDYLKAERLGNENSFDPEDKAEAFYTFGFVEGMRDGVVLQAIVKLINEYGGDLEDVPRDFSVEGLSGFCIDDPYVEIIGKLRSFVREKGFKKNEEFFIVFLQFVQQEYTCK